MMMKQLIGQQQQQRQQQLVQTLKNNPNDDDDDEDEEACQVVDEDELRDSSIHEGCFNALPSFRRVHASLASHKAAVASAGSSNTNNQIISQDNTNNAQAIPLKGKAMNPKQVSISKIISLSGQGCAIQQQSTNNQSSSSQLYQFLFSDQMLLRLLPFLNISEVLHIYQLFVPCEFSLSDIGINKVASSKNTPKTQLQKNTATPIIAVSSASTTAQTSLDTEYCFVQQSGSSTNSSKDCQFFHVRFSPSRRILAAALSARLCQSIETITSKESQEFFSTTIRMEAITKIFPSDLFLKMQMPSGYEQDIQRDAERTFLDKLKPSERHSCIQQLITVLKGLSQSIKEIGYIQGWNNIAGSLIRMEFPQELTYWTLNYFLKKMQLKQLYIDDFKAAHFLDYALEVFCKNYLPELFKFMKGMDLELCYFSTSWFLTLFSVELSPEAQVKVLMLISLKGWKYLIKIALAVLIVTKGKSDEEEINQVLKKSASQHLLQNEQQLFRTAQKVKVTNTLLSRLQHLHQTSGSKQNVQIKRIKIAQNTFKTIIELPQQQQQNQQQQQQYFKLKSGLNNSVFDNSRQQQQYQQSSQEIFCKGENEEVEEQENSSINDFQITYYYKSSQDNNNNNITMRSQQLLSMNNNSCVELISESGGVMQSQTKQQNLQQISLSSRESNNQDDTISNRNGKGNNNNNTNITRNTQDSTNKQSKKGILDGLVMFLENRWTHREDQSQNSNASQDTPNQSQPHLLSVPRNQQPIRQPATSSISKAHNATTGMRRHTEMGVHSDEKEQTFFHKKLLKLTQDQQSNKNHSSTSSSNDSSNEEKKDTKDKQKDIIVKNKSNGAPVVSLLKQSKSTIVSSSPKKSEDQEEDSRQNEKPEDSSFLQKIIRIFKPKDNNNNRIKRLSYSNNTMDQDTISSGRTQASQQTAELSCQNNQQKIIASNSRLQRNKSHDIGIFQQSNDQPQYQQDFTKGDIKNQPSMIIQQEDQSNELGITPSNILQQQHSRQQSHTPSQSSSQSTLGYYSIQTTNRKSSRLPNTKKVFTGMQQQSQQQLPSWNHSERMHLNNPQPFSVSVNHNPPQLKQTQSALVPSQYEQMRQTYNTAVTNNNNNNSNNLSSKPNDNSHKYDGSQQIQQKQQQQQSEEQEQSFSIARKSSYLPTKHPYFQQLAQNYQQPSNSSLEPPFTPLCYQSIPTNSSSSEIQINHHQNSTDGWENYNSTVVSEHSSTEATHTPPFFLHSNQRKKNETKKMPQQYSLNSNIANPNAVVESYGLGMTNATTSNNGIKQPNNMNNLKINNGLLSSNHNNNHDQKQQQPQQLLSDWRNTLKKPTDNSQICNSSTEFSLNESQQLQSVLNKQRNKVVTTTQHEISENIASFNNNSKNNQNQFQGIGYLQGFKHSTSDIALQSQKKPNNRYAEHVLKGQQITHL